MHRSLSVICSAFTLSLLVAGCGLLIKQPPVEKKSALISIAPSAYPEFFDDMAYDGLAHSLLKSISYLKRVPANRTFRFGKDLFDSGHMIKSFEHFLYFIQGKPSKRDLETFIASNYLIYQSIGREKKRRVFFTGYYEPILQGCIEQTPEYGFPIYARPDDLVTADLSLFSSRFKGEKIIGKYTGQTVVPYPDRKDIEQEGFFIGKALPLAWVNDRVDLFFLHIQGSGKICLESGETINVHYHTTNGRPYRSIGRLLIEKGKIPRTQMSMQKIRAYLQDHPGEVDKVLHYNPSYVFFKIEKDGPLGYLGVKLTPGRSIALDRRLFPPAGLAFVESKKPVIDGSGKIHSWIDLSRFVLNQDTGGAIRGPGRADLFWGNGRYAEIAAGHMKHNGRLYFLVLKPDAK